MGQYYHPTILCKTNKLKVKAWAYSHNYKETWTNFQGVEVETGTGLKLMEHSWMKNGFVTAFCRLLVWPDNMTDWKDKGRFAGYPVVWAGDYADFDSPCEVDPNEQLACIRTESGGKDYENGKRCRACSRGNTFDQCEDKLEVKLEKVPEGYELPPLIHNLDKKVYVDIRNVKAYDIWNDGDPWAIHPLPLLTCDGNGRGGGDFMGADPEGLVGSWARDRIVIASAPLPKFTEMPFDLKES